MVRKAKLRPASPARRKRYSVERLEDRLTPSALIVNGNANLLQNVITLGANIAGAIVLTLNDKVTTYTPGRWSSVVVNPGGGVNIVNLNALPSGVPVTINIAAGATDAIALGNGNLSGLSGGVTVNGDGHDELSMEDSADFLSQSYTITNTSVTATNGSGTGSEFGGLSYNAIAGLSLAGGSATTGNDGFNEFFFVQSTAAGARLHR